MLLLNIDHVPGREIEALSIVKGTVVQSKNFGKDFMAGMKTPLGGLLLRAPLLELLVSHQQKQGTVEQQQEHDRYIFQTVGFHS